MKKVFCLPIFYICALAQAQQHSLHKIWETDTVVAIPESVLPIPGRDQMYVSLINGGGWEVDGKGGVGVISRGGQHFDSTWIEGLDAPKGMGLVKDRLYVADISKVVVIDTKKGKIIKRIAIDSAQGLNDITVNSKGVVYVSDSRTGRIWQIKNDRPSLYMSNVQGVNGLKAVGDQLVIGGGKNLLLTNGRKEIIQRVELPQSIDGIEPVGNGDYLVTAWVGYVFYVRADGSFETLLDSHLDKMNTADIGFDLAKQIVYVPTFNAKKIVAYQLTAGNGPGAAPRVFIMDADRLVRLKNRIRMKSAAEVALAASLRKQADSLLTMKPLSVMDKSSTPVSGNKHDYMSQAPYFWYDSTRPNGLPYIRRDGQHNPEIKRITDHDYLSTLDNAVRTLSLAWWLTNEDQYAQKASDLIRHWFLDEATRMNPNLEYAQGIPGINNGRGIGIIETRSLTGIADAVGLLAGSSSWTAADDAALKNWYAQYLNWLLTSKNGKDEHAAKNNHGTWFYDQAIDFALFTGDKARAKELVEEAKKRLDSQLTAQGTFPLELERTNALGYSTFNTQAWFNVARLAEATGIDLWNYTTSKGATLRTALDWLEPYALGEKKWTYQQIGPYNRSEFYTLLLQAAAHYPKSNYLAKAESIRPGRDNVMVELLNRR